LNAQNILAIIAFSQAYGIVHFTMCTQ